jgi:hypothetical protein
MKHQEKVVSHRTATAVYVLAPAACRLEMLLTLPLAILPGLTAQPLFPLLGERVRVRASYNFNNKNITICLPTPKSKRPAANQTQIRPNQTKNVALHPAPFSILHSRLVLGWPRRQPVPFAAPIRTYSNLPAQKITSLDQAKEPLFYWVIRKKTP